MQMAGKAMQSIHKEVGGVDKVDDIMADIEESNMIAGEIGEAISRPMNIGAMDDFDDDDLQLRCEYWWSIRVHLFLLFIYFLIFRNQVSTVLFAELEDLEQEELDSNLVTVNPTPQMHLPSVPSNNLPAVRQQPTKEDQDLEDLNSWIMN